MVQAISWLPWFLVLIICVINHKSVATNSSTKSSDRISLYSIEGQIILPPGPDKFNDIRILVDEGVHIGIPRVDGTFVISGIPSGSYIVSISSPRHNFNSVRVDINSHGKIRACQVNLLQPNKIVRMKYPLRFETYTEPQYFGKREAYTWTDLIFNPILSPIFMMIPLFFILPRMLPQGEEADQATQQMNNMFQPNVKLPDLTDFFIRIFGAPRRQRRQSEPSIAGDTATPANTRRRRQRR